MCQSVLCVVGGGSSALRYLAHGGFGMKKSRKNRNRAYYEAHRAELAARGRAYYEEQRAELAARDMIRIARNLLKNGLAKNENEAQKYAKNYLGIA